MAAMSSALKARREPAVKLPPVRAAVLARLACDGGASKAELQRDTAPLMAPRLTTGEARQTVERALAALVMAGLAYEDKARFGATPSGCDALAEAIGLRSSARKLSWSQLRDVWLVAAALGLGMEGPARIKRLAKPDGLRAVIVQKAYGLPIRPDTSPSKLRGQLAVIALERAFGNKIKSGFGDGGLSAKAGRLLASQLSAGQREFGTDARLIAALAAEHAGARKPDVDALVLAILKRWISEGLEAEAAAGHVELAPALQPAPLVAANDAASARPDLAGFSAAVLYEAERRADGWPGNRKAFISHVWQAIRDAHPAWRLTEIEFKCMLAEAHRAGLVVLANADLKDKSTVKEVQESAVSYKNTVWHLIRVVE